MPKTKKTAENKAETKEVLSSEKAKKNQKNQKTKAKTEKPAKKPAKTRKNADNPKNIADAVVPAEIEKQEKPLKPEPEKKGKYKNIGTFSADIENEFAYKNLNKRELENKAFAFLNRCKENGEILVGTATQLVEDETRYKCGISVSFEPFPNLNHYGLVEVIIPEEVFMVPNFEYGKDYAIKSKKEQYRTRKYRISAYLRAKVHFCVTSVFWGPSTVDPNVEVIYAVGDRLMAMDKMMDKYFFHRNRKKERTEEPITIKVGDIVEAFVLAVYDRYVTVMALGVETRIYLHDLTRDSISRCGEYVSAGAILPNCTVLGIKIKDNKAELRLTNLSNDLPSSFYRIKEGSYCIGRVTGYNQELDQYLIYLGNGVTAYVYASNVVPKGTQLSINDSVNVFIRGISGNGVIGNAIKV